MNLLYCRGSGKNSSDELYQKVKEKLASGETSSFVIEDDGTMRLNSRLYVPSQSAVKAEILEEAHLTKYVIHPGETKMFRDLKQNF